MNNVINHDFKKPKCDLCKAVLRPFTQCTTLTVDGEFLSLETKKGLVCSKCNFSVLQSVSRIRDIDDGGDM